MLSPGWRSSSRRAQPFGTPVPLIERLPTSNLGRGTRVLRHNAGRVLCTRGRRTTATTAYDPATIHRPHRPCGCILRRHVYALPRQASRPRGIRTTSDPTVVHSDRRHSAQPHASLPSCLLLLDSFSHPYIPLSVCLLYVSILIPVWRHIPSPSPSTLDLPAHLHVTTCIDFGSCRAYRVVSSKLFCLFFRHT